MTGSISEFYKGKNVFITGGTGFIGRVLIEKLLRSCPEIGNIYVLVRRRKGVDIWKRVDELVNLPKIIPIEGNCMSLRLGLSDADYQILEDNVNIVFHVAATVRFDDPLGKATFINVRATREVMYLAKKMKNFECCIIDAIDNDDRAMKDCAKTVNEVASEIGCNSDLKPLERKTVKDHDKNKDAFVSKDNDTNISGCNITHKGSNSPAITKTTSVTQPPNKRVNVGKNVFITGGTGFIGRVLIEKLLRSCPDIGNIYVLIRRRKGVYELLRDTFPENLKKIIPIEGDCMSLGLGLSDADYQILEDNVNIVFHIAASVRFDDPIGKATILNVRATWEIMLLAKKMKNLEKVIEERFYPPPADWRKFIELVETSDNYTLDILELKLASIQRKIWRALIAVEPFNSNEWTFKHDRTIWLNKQLGPNDNAFNIEIFKELTIEERIDRSIAGVGKYLLKETQSIEENRRQLNRIKLLEKSISEFYKGKNVFITGGTGFIGRVLIEKLLRSCPDIGNIYVLIRRRKGVDIWDRVDEIVNLPLFEVLKEKYPENLKKIIPVEGDCKSLRLGISDADYQILEDNVNIVFHVAATVRFDDPIGRATILNVRATREIMFLAKKMKDLEVLIHVSTMYCNCDKKVIEEKFYPPPADWRKFIELVETCDNYTLDILEQKIRGVLPNTYVFTKALAEHVYEVLRDTFPENLKKIIPIEGDCMSLGLGLSDADYQILEDNVNIVFHVAASVRFDDPLRKATILNVRATREIMLLAKKIKNLETYINLCVIIEISKIIGRLPNTYLFTKALAEHVVKDLADNLPILIVRPSIVINTWYDPFPGWIDNWNGPIGITISGAKGVMRTIYIKNGGRTNLDCIPCDYAISKHSKKAMNLCFNDIYSYKNVLCENTYKKPEMKFYVINKSRHISAYITLFSPFNVKILVFNLEKCFIYIYIFANEDNLVFIENEHSILRRKECACQQWTLDGNFLVLVFNRQYSLKFENQLYCTLLLTTKSKHSGNRSLHS
ncbi:hypothetical protein C0J52_06907 [Blattella germanica]|nr:hypothetical protein C0J52_06907 [Blattella germanica]